MNSRRAFLEKFAAIGAIGLAPVALTGQAPRKAEDATNLIIAGPYLQNVGNDEATIVWVTEKNSFGWVEYGSGRYTNLKALAYNNGLIDANTRINKVRLTGLKPGAEYNYQVVSTEVTGYDGSRVNFGASIASKPFTFKTSAADEKEVKIIVLNDIHDRPQIIPELIYRHGFTGIQRDFDLVVFNGDCFDWVTGEDQMVKNFLVPSVDVFASQVPFLFVQGNHECRGAFSRELPKYYAYPSEKYYHAFTRGPVRFVVLDSGEDKTDDSVEYLGLSAFDRYREEQQKWLAQEIESEDFRKAPFKVVLIHISPYHSGEWHGTLHCREMFGPLLNKAKIDLQISGHTHRYATHAPDNDHNYPIVIGGGPLEGQRTIMKFHATESQLDIQTIRDDGEVVGKFNLKRKT